MFLELKFKNHKSARTMCNTLGDWNLCFYFSLTSPSIHSYWSEASDCWLFHLGKYNRRSGTSGTYVVASTPQELHLLRCEARHWYGLHSVRWVQPSSATFSKIKPWAKQNHGIVIDMDFTLWGGFSPRMQNKPIKTMSLIKPRHCRWYGLHSLQDTAKQINEINDGIVFQMLLENHHLDKSYKD